MTHARSHSLSLDTDMQNHIMSSQQEVFRRRMSLHIPSSAPLTSASPEMQSLSSSPTYSRPFYSASWAPSREYPPSRPIPIHLDMAHAHAGEEPQVEDAKTNQQIKATLTELLNTDSVRSNEKYRAWVQERLMDAERGLRRQRRRRSSNSINGEELASSIAEHISPHEYHLNPCKTWG